MTSASYWIICVGKGKYLTSRGQHTRDLAKALWVYIDCRDYAEGLCSGNPGKVSRMTVTLEE